MQLTNFLWLVVQGLLILALPILIAAGVQHFLTMRQELKMKIGQEREQHIEQALTTAVKFAEQVGVSQGLIGPEKKKEAIQTAQKFLAEHGIQLDLAKLDTLIEAEVQTQFSKPTPPTDTPEARQALLNSVCQAAVQAAEQSGLAGLIQNVGSQKKAYALQMALTYLGQVGVKADPNMVSGVIEAQVNALRTGGSLPSAAPAPASSQPGPAATGPAG